MAERPDIGLARELALHSDNANYLAASLLDMIDWTIATEARLAAALVVVDAARAWRHADSVGEQVAVYSGLIDAVDAWEAGAE